MLSKVNVCYRARIPVVLIESFDENNVEEEIKDYGRIINVPVIKWDLYNGFSVPSLDMIKGTDPKTIRDPVEALTTCLTNCANGAIWMFYDLPHFMREPIVKRLLKSIYTFLRVRNKGMVLIIGEDIPEVQRFIPKYSESLPTRKDIREFLENNKVNFEVNDRDLDAVVTSLLGLTKTQIEDACARSLVESFYVKPATLQKYKEETIRKDIGLEIVDPRRSVSIGGLDLLCGDIRRMRKLFSEEAERYGATPPRGYLLVGPPGTGKSLAAKHIARELGFPLLRLEISRVSSQWYGQTTARMKRVLDIADAMSPSILWIDEVEKILNSGSNLELHEETNRATSVLLTHMQESTGKVLYVGTCNTPRIPPELLQRFERCFFVDLPTKKAREDIFALHIAQSGRDYMKFDIPLIAERTEGFSGREIASVVREGLIRAFNDGREPVTDDFLLEACRVVPTSVSRKSEIEKLREWARKNAMPAEIEVV